MVSLPPSNNSLDNGSSPTPEPSVASTLAVLRDLRRHADFVNTAMAGGVVVAGVVLKYLPLSGAYFAMTAPCVVLFFMLGFGAIARKLVKKKRKRKARKRPG